MAHSVELCAEVGDGTNLDGHDLLPKIILGVKFTDGIEVAAKSAAEPKNAA